jgi:hypothetical protein
MDGILQEEVEGCDVALVAASGELGGAGHASPQHGVEVQGPADVVVVAALVAVRHPAALAAEAVVQREVGLHVLRRPRPADGAQEGLHHEAEPEPVGARIGVVAHGGGEVVDDAGLRRLVEALPDPGARHVEDQGERRRLDLGLRVLVEADPAVGSRRIHSRADALGEEIDEVVDALSALARDAEAREQEGAGEALETVDIVTITALGAGRRDAAAALGAVRHGALEEAIGERRPIGTGPAGGLGCHRILLRRRGVP